MHGAKVALLGVVLVANLYGVAERRIRLVGEVTFTLMTRKKSKALG